MGCRTCGPLRTLAHLNCFSSTFIIVLLLLISQVELKPMILTKTLATADSQPIKSGSEFLHLFKNPIRHRHRPSAYSAAQQKRQFSIIQRGLDLIPKHRQPAKLRHFLPVHHQINRIRPNSTTTLKPHQRLMKRFKSGDENQISQQWQFIDKTPGRLYLRIQLVCNDVPTSRYLEIRDLENRTRSRPSFKPQVASGMSSEDTLLIREPGQLNGETTFNGYPLWTYKQAHGNKYLCIQKSGQLRAMDSYERSLRPKTCQFIELPGSTEFLDYKKLIGISPRTFSQRHVRGTPSSQCGAVIFETATRN